MPESSGRFVLKTMIVPLLLLAVFPGAIASPGPGVDLNPRNLEVTGPSNLDNDDDNTDYRFKYDIKNIGNDSISECFSIEHWLTNSVTGATTQPLRTKDCAGLDANSGRSYTEDVFDTGQTNWCCGHVKVDPDNKIVEDNDDNNIAHDNDITAGVIAGVWKHISISIWNGDSTPLKTLTFVDGLPQDWLAVIDSRSGKGDYAPDPDVSSQLVVSVPPLHERIVYLHILPPPAITIYPTFLLRTDDLVGRGGGDQFYKIKLVDPNVTGDTCTAVLFNARTVKLSAEPRSP